MTDHAVKLASRRGPLEGISLPRADKFSVAQSPHAARFILRGESALVSAFGPAALGTLRASASGSRVALWLGPDEFLLLAPGEDAIAIGSELKQALPADSSSLVDVSHRQIGLALEGRLAARCLSAGCPLDLGLAAFPIGMATRTIYLKTEIVLWRQAEVRFHVEVWR
jgi:sarcosine oxidase subunit gamma